MKLPRSSRNSENPAASHPNRIGTHTAGIPEFLPLLPAVKRISLKACAKINLGLAVLGRRPDGYHELRTIFQTISLADRLEIRLIPARREVLLDTTGFEVPAGKENLAARAAEVALEELKLRAQVEIMLDKRIPPASGLGGASSDAAAVLRAVCLLAGRTLPPECLLRLAAALGSDVPFFLYGGKALGLGRGEEVYPLPEGPRRHCVLLFPGEGMSTAEAYRSLHRPPLTPGSTGPTIEWAEKIGWFCGAVNEGPERASGSKWRFESFRIENDFEPSVFRKFPILAQSKKILLRAGAETASLSGSGSAVYGLFGDSSKARRAAQQLQGRAKHVFLARTVSRREFGTQFRAPEPRAAFR
jgi:4-diphosphocytidyl-2-C-methyl-D-erythritol kinase